MTMYEQGVVDRYRNHKFGVNEKEDKEINYDYKNLRISKETIEKHDETLIGNWNSVVDKKDVIYHLGDFFFGDVEKGRSIIKRLNGTKIFIRGNHDKNLDHVIRDFCATPADLKEITINDETAIHGKQNITLCHYAMRVWNKSHYGAFMLYGHSHGSLPDDPNSLSIDVGVDCHNYFPISYNKVKEIMSNKIYKPVDHHRVVDSENT